MLSLLGFRIVRRDGRIQALGCLRIGGVAYCVWAFPPNAGGAAHRHVQAHRRHVEYPTVADTVIETKAVMLTEHALPSAEMAKGSPLYGHETVGHSRAG